MKLLIILLSILVLTAFALFGKAAANPANPPNIHVKLIAYGSITSEAGVYASGSCKHTAVRSPKVLKGDMALEHYATEPENSMLMSTGVDRDGWIDLTTCNIDQQARLFKAIKIIFSVLREVKQ